MGEIVDIHAHLWAKDWLPTEWWEALIDIIVRENEKHGRKLEREAVRKKYLPTYWDPDAEHLLTRMDEADIDRQVIFPIDWGVLMTDPPTSIKEVNRHFAGLQDAHEELIAFATIDPRRDGAVEFVERALGDWGMQGLKLHPTAGFHLHDPETYELLAVAADYYVPVLTDSGPISAPLYSKYSHPIHVDEILVDFSDLAIITAHMSLGWWRDLLAIADMKVNSRLHVDISAWQDRAAERPEEFATAVRGFIDALGDDRVHFGTDDPGFDPTYPKEDWINQVRSLTTRENDPTFTDDEIKMVLGKGAEPLV